jgi:monothiol glutaredoxin
MGIPCIDSSERNTMTAQDIHDWIDREVKGNDVVLFMKGTKSFPQCGFSGRLAQILDYLGVNYKDVNVLDDMAVRDGIKAYTNWPTIPQLYVKGEFVGGCDIVSEMFQSGELEQHLRERGVQYSKAVA